MAESRWSEGDVVALKHAGTPPILVPIRRGPQRVGDAAVLDLTDQIGQPVGGSIEWVGTHYAVLRPSLSDLLSTMTRGAQIITPKDAAYLVLLAGIGPGDRVAEAGSGSGALTTVLAYTVGPTGRVDSFDRRPEALHLARQNLERGGLSNRVTFHERDVLAHGIEGAGYDAVVLDLPEPWGVLASVRAALSNGGRVVTYTPTYNQLERTVRALREIRFDEVRSVELLERPLHVGDGGTRPAFEMLGHTGFLTVGRKVD
ncbi:MAG: tRNA (adenine-N1)-methyltransferase [Thermoplasmata archaeon]